MGDGSGRLRARRRSRRSGEAPGAFRGCPARGSARIGQRTHPGGTALHALGVALQHIVLAPRYPAGRLRVAQPLDGALHDGLGVAQGLDRPVVGCNERTLSCRARQRRRGQGAGHGQGREEEGFQRRGSIGRGGRECPPTREYFRGAEEPARGSSPLGSQVASQVADTSSGRCASLRVKRRHRQANSSLPALPDGNRQVPANSLALALLWAAAVIQKDAPTDADNAPRPPGRCL